MQLHSCIALQDNYFSTKSPYLKFVKDWPKLHPKKVQVSTTAVSIVMVTYYTPDET